MAHKVYVICLDNLNFQCLGTLGYKLLANNHTFATYRIAVIQQNSSFLYSQRILNILYFKHFQPCIKFNLKLDN